MSINICFNDGAVFGPEWASTSASYVWQPILTSVRISLELPNIVLREEYSIFL